MLINNTAASSSAAAAASTINIPTTTTTQSLSSSSSSTSSASSSAVSSNETSTQHQHQQQHQHHHEQQQHQQQNQSVNNQQIIIPTKLYVTNFPYASTQQQIYDLFSRYGTINECTLKKDYYAYIQYEQAKSAQTACKNANGMKILNKKLIVYLALNKKLQQQQQQQYQQMNDNKNKLLLNHTKIIHIRNFPEAYSQQQIKDLFLVYGNILDCQIIYDSYAFIHYKSPIDAKNALNLINGTLFMEQKLIVQYSKSKFKQQATTNQQTNQNDDNNNWNHNNNDDDDDNNNSNNNNNNNDDYDDDSNKLSLMNKNNNFHYNNNNNYNSFNNGHNNNNNSSSSSSSAYYNQQYNYSNGGSYGGSYGNYYQQQHINAFNPKYQTVAGATTNLSVNTATTTTALANNRQANNSTPVSNMNCNMSSNSSSYNSHKTKLYVTNFPEEMDQDEMKALFKQYGDVLECTIMWNQYAFIHFSSYEQAEKALTGIKGSQYKGYKLSVQWSTSSKYQQPKQSKQPQAAGVSQPPIIVTPPKKILERPGKSQNNNELDDKLSKLDLDGEGTKTGMKKDDLAIINEEQKTGIKNTTTTYWATTNGGGSSWAAIMNNTNPIADNSSEISSQNKNKSSNSNVVPPPPTVTSSTSTASNSTNNNFKFSFSEIVRSSASTSSAKSLTTTSPIVTTTSTSTSSTASIATNDLLLTKSASTVSTSTHQQQQQLKTTSMHAIVNNNNNNNNNNNMNSLPQIQQQISKSSNYVNELLLQQQQHQVNSNINQFYVPSSTQSSMFSNSHTAFDSISPSPQQQLYQNSSRNQIGQNTIVGPNTNSSSGNLQLQSHIMNNSQNRSAVPQQNFMMNDVFYQSPNHPQLQVPNGPIQAARHPININMRNSIQQQQQQHPIQSQRNLHMPPTTAGSVNHHLPQQPSQYYQPQQHQHYGSVNGAEQSYVQSNNPAAQFGSTSNVHYQNPYQQQQQHLNGGYESVYQINSFENDFQHQAFNGNQGHIQAPHPSHNPLFHHTTGSAIHQQTQNPAILNHQQQYQGFANQQQQVWSDYNNANSNNNNGIANTFNADIIDYNAHQQLKSISYQGGSLAQPQYQTRPPNSYQQHLIAPVNTATVYNSQVNNNNLSNSSSTKYNGSTSFISQQQQNHLINFKNANISGLLENENQSLANGFTSSALLAVTSASTATINSSSNSSSSNNSIKMNGTSHQNGGGMSYSNSYVLFPSDSLELEKQDPQQKKSLKQQQQQQQQQQPQNFYQIEDVLANLIR